MLVDYSSVVHVLRRLGAHQTVAIASVRGEDNIVRRTNSIQALRMAPLEVKTQDVAFRDVFEMLSRVDEGCVCDAKPLRMEKIRRSIGQNACVTSKIFPDSNASAKHADTVLTRLAFVNRP